MNKNLKKVISAVAALAMTASTFVAFAADYPDVDASASYKKAVDELSALNIINGYEDGTFQPDKLVNRAEFAKMAVTAMGKTVIAQAEAAANTNTEFTDVKADHWAAGYVSAATAVKLINGMGDGTFAPDANITYAQAMKMLVCAAGYEQWSVDKGGWPTGYMFYGNQLDIGKGVKDVVQDTEITRAQCAQMIDNVLNAPVCVETGDWAFDMYGRQYQKLKAKDGYGIDYQTILTKNHDVYRVKGIVDRTNRSSQNGVRADEVDFTVRNARNWLDQEDQISKSKANPESITGLKVGDTNIADYLKQYVEVLIQETEDEEYVALSVSLAGQTEKVELSAYDHDYKNSKYDGDDYAGSDYLYFYAGNKTNKYKIDGNLEMYVNGVEYADVNEGIKTYVNDKKASVVTLVKTPDENGQTDDIYDLLFVDAYATAVVDYVDDAETDEPRINLIYNDVAGATNSWDIDMTEDDVAYSFTKDGAAISVADLNEYDVLSIMYDVNGDFDESYFYDVIVSSATETGRYESQSTNDNGGLEYTINGTKYTLNDMVGALEAGTTYTFYLDAFGQIAYKEDEESIQNYAILDSVYGPVRGEDYEATIILPDGSKLTKVLKETKKVNADDEYTKEVAEAFSIVYNAGDTKKAPQDRVVKYTINGSDELAIKSGKAEVIKANAQDAEYRESNGRIGGVKFSDTTSFMSISTADLKDITAMEAASLKDGNNYTVYAFGQNSDKTYKLILVEDSIGALTPTTSLAVFDYSYSTTNSTDTEVDAIMVAVDGKLKPVLCDSDVDIDSFNLTRGEVIVYTTNAVGEITDITTVVEGYNTTTAFWKVANKDTANLFAVDTTKVLGNNTQKYRYEMFVGAITDRTSNSLDIADVEDGKSDLVNTTNIGYDDKVNVYVIDYNERSENRISVGGTGSVVKSSVPRTAVDDFEWASLGKNSNPNIAIVKTVNNNATDIVVIIPKKGEFTALDAA